MISLALSWQLPVHILEVDHNLTRACFVAEVKQILMAKCIGPQFLNEVAATVGC